ncbi:hypothetical protein EJ04DRAFT_595782 [Polyplosphaeria fusca]|uniref:Uncharacterized protein n=1 Tax=Polyplosphaeria fusca TaxID=682080 RepID=A0A9P4QLS9_9PLEO|nr:hypothetical protein EJ04DRAFT_595782 [Polyplosphaeria fusca]
MQTTPTEPKYAKAPTGDNQSEQQAQEPTASKDQPGGHRFSLLPWVWEIAAWVGSCSFFIGVVVTLSVLDKQPQPNFKYHITPNAIIGLLSTFAELLLIMPLQSSIGQLKWLRAMRTRPLDDFRAIDAASRGPLGSLILLARQAGGVTISIGALISILALGINVFIQQTLRYEQIWEPTGEAVLPVAQWSDQDGWIDLEPGSYAVGLDPELQSASYIALLSPPGKNFNATALQCSTGNCTWPSYETLGVCSTCANLTSELETVSVSVNNTPTEYYTLKNGMVLTGLDPEQSISISILNITTSYRQGLDGWYDAWQPMAFPNKGSKITNVMAIGLSPGQVPGFWSRTSEGDQPVTTTKGFRKPVAYECIFQFCIRNMQAKLMNESLVETETSRWINDTLFLNWDDPHIYDQNITFRSAPEASDTYYVSPENWGTLDQLLSSFLVTNGSLLEGYIPFSNEATTMAILRTMNKTVDGFPALMNNVANSLSLSLRSMPRQPTVSGQALSMTSHARVRWEWLALPLFELVATLVFLITVIIKTRRQGLQPWSNNVLAYFFHGLDDRPVGVMAPQTVMESKAKQILVEFVPHSDGGRLVPIKSDDEVVEERADA